MKAIQYLLVTLGSLFLIPIVLGIVVMSGNFSTAEPGALIRCFWFFEIIVAYYVREAGASEGIVDTGGYIAHFTLGGFVIVYVLPAIFCFGSALAIQLVRTGFFRHPKTN